MILLVVIEHLAGQFQHIFIFFVPGSYYYFEPGQLHLRQLELFHINAQNSLPAFVVGLDIGGVVHILLQFDLELPSFHLGVHLLSCSEFIGVVDIDEIWFYVVRDCLVVFGFPEAGLPGCSKQVF